MHLQAVLQKSGTKTLLQKKKKSDSPKWMDSKSKDQISFFILNQ